MASTEPATIFIIIAAIFLLLVEGQTYKKRILGLPTHLFLEEDSTYSTLYLSLSDPPTQNVTLSFDQLISGTGTSIMQIMTPSLFFTPALYSFAQPVDLWGNGTVNGTNTVVTGLFTTKVTSADPEYNNIQVPKIRFTVWRRPGRVDANGNVIG
jgi:hypothetical protein